ncbi:MAG: TonB-dependent receptor [Pseudomonadota bacterium]
MKSFSKHYLAVMMSAACHSLVVNNVVADTIADDRAIEEVIVTTSPFSKSAETVNHPVNILSGDALRNAAAATLGETLNDQLGVSSASFGPGVGMPIIRGQSDNRVKVMQDSVGAMDASAASPDHAIALEPLLASKIEVLRGPAALRYGSGAIGGVVNVLDNRIPSSLPERFNGAAELRNTSANDESVGVVNLNAALGTFAIHLDGIKRESSDSEIPGFAQKNTEDVALTTNGFIANTNAEATSGTLGASYVGDKGFVGLSLNQLDNNYGVPPEGEDLVRIDMHQTRYDIKGELDNPFAGFEKITARLGHNDYEHTEVENGENGTVFTNDAYEGRAELIHDPVKFLNMDWKGALGTQASQSTFAAVGEEAFIPKSDISNLGFFVLEERTHGIWTFELGARLDTQTITPENESSIKHRNNLSLSGSTAWHFTHNQKFVIGIARSQRAPSVEELLAKGPHPATGSYLIGDESLDTETSKNVELGYHWHIEAIKVSANVFYNQISDFIYAKNTNQMFGELNEELIGYQYTQANATFKGWEAEIEIPIARAWDFRFFSDRVRATLDSGEDLPRITPPRVGTSLDYDWNAWSGNLSLTHTARQSHAGDNESETEGYDRVDARVSYTIENAKTDYTLFLKATNLLDAEIRNASSYLRERAPEAGRSLQVGLRINF